MFYGAVAAIAWGLATVAAANGARRLGTYPAVLLGQGIGAVTLVLLAAMMRPSLTAVGGMTAVGLAGAGLLGLAGWLSYYQALARGPVAMVSAIGATYGGVAMILALAMLGEHLTRVGEAGVVLAITGITLATARAARSAPAAVPAAAVATRARHAAPARLRPGPVALACASALTYGFSAFLLGSYSASAGWLAAALVEYTASLAALLVMVPFLTGSKILRARGPGVAWAAAAGVAEAGALLAFARGGQLGEVAMTAALSSLYPAIPLAVGVLLFRERLTRRQLLGVGVILAGLVMIGLA